MTNNIEAMFASVREDATELSTELRNCCERVYGELPPGYESDGDSEFTFDSLKNVLTGSVEELCDRLENPTLILATTGTTSSGKSTLVNLLCGAEIMPVAVQEMSAGIVTIEYSEQKAIVVEETVGATWECGKWHNVDNEGIYSRLDQVMKSYLKSKANGTNNVACPQSTVYYPFRLVAEPDLLDLPRGTTVKIMDLPGLAHVGDQGNAAVIKKSRDALCLVTYNSAETDRERVASLLQEVVDQVKELGGSPARMLFVLNRIDVFRSDRDWPTSEESFVLRTDEEIRRKLKNDLGEFSAEIDAIEITKLSSLPALLALEMVSGTEAEKVKASEQLDNFFNFLIPKDILGDMPRNVSNWEDHGRKRLSEAILPKTNAIEFHRHLKQHIQDKYPQLIIPQILKRFEDNAASKLVEWLSQTTNSVINSSEKQYGAECERIEEIKANLGKSTLEKTKALREPFDEIKTVLKGTLDQDAEADSDSPDPLYTLEKTIKGLVNNDSFGKRITDRLLPLYDWKRELTKAIEKIVFSILNALQDNKSVLDDKAFEYARPHNVQLLEGIIQDLIEEDYLFYAGRDFEAKTDQRKEKLKKLNRKLNALSSVLKLIVDDVAKKVLDREMGRVRDAVESLFVFHLQALEENARSIAPDLGISFSQTALIRVDFTANPNFSFEGGFPVFQKTYQEQISEKTGKRRVWWTGFIWNKDVYETKMEERSSDNASIPSIDNLERGWKFQKDKGEIEVLKQISAWWLAQLDQFNSGIESFQKDVIDRYQERLDRAYKEIKIDYDSEMEIWQPLKQEAERVSEKAKQFGTRWRSNS